MEILTRAMEQRPYKGVRKSKSVIVRNTYPELRSTTIKTFLDWFDPICEMKYDSPITGTIEIPDIGDGTGLWHEATFLAIDRPDDVRKLKSLEVTFGWANEASELERTVIEMMTSRLDRYPAKRNGGASWVGLFMDTNPPDDDHWWYHWDEKETPETYEFFNQPGGLMKIVDPKNPKNELWVPNPMAENIQNLQSGYNYYLRQLAGKTEEWIKVFLGGMYGTTLDGKPVYQGEWNQDAHLAKEALKPIPGRPLVGAFDFGLTPACIFGQMDARGRLNILSELVAEDMGIRRFYTDVVLPWVAENYRGYRIDWTGDPAGSIRSQTDEFTPIQELADMGCICEPAVTNEFTSRRESVAFFLTKMAAGETGFLLDPSCKVLKKGFTSGYRYERLKVSGSSRFKDRPVKDKYSHPHDALQYLCLHFRGEANPVRRREVQPVSMSGWT
jgi:hypothetical protein